MVLPESELNRLKTIAKDADSTGIISSTDHNYVIRIARIAPTALDEISHILTSKLNSGAIPGAFLHIVFSCLCQVADSSEYLRKKIVEEVNQETLDFHVANNVDKRISSIAKKLTEVLSIERPRYYFDLCRKILTSNGSFFIIGAGFSYDSHAPLLHEMEGIACSTLDSLGITNPRELYHADEEKVWEIIAGGWQTFQKYVSYTLSPKEPSEQHSILAELFHEGHIVHIISLNWDDLTEKAYHTLYGENICIVNSEGSSSKHALWKLHGDIANANERWVLPFEEGRVFTPIADIVQQTTLPAFSIGYREQEKEISERIIGVFKKRGGITRIRLDLESKPPDAFQDNALMAMRKIKSSIESAKKAKYPE